MGIEHESYLREHDGIQPDEDYEMNLKDSDRKKLWALAGNKCSRCNRDLILEDGTNVGEECHISSFKPNKPSKEFSRYNSNLTKNKRDSYDNAILLCANCHKVIDNPENTQFTIEELHQIKETHEADIKTGNPKQIKANQEVEREAKQIENHTTALKETIQEWQKKLPEIELAEETGNPNKFHKFDISFIKDIETCFLFKVGDVFYHCDGLNTIWSDFKVSIINYRSKKHELFCAIKEYTKQELKNRKFNIESEILEGFYISVYRELILKVKGKISIYGYPEPISILHSEKDGLKFQLNYCQKADGGFFTETCHTFSETQTRERLGDIVSIYTELTKDYKEQYVEQSKTLIEMEDELEKCKIKLSDSLEKIWHSSISKMDCEFVKGKQHGT